VVELIVAIYVSLSLKTFKGVYRLSRPEIGKSKAGNVQKLILKLFAMLPAVQSIIS
jgi:hypothetical protein